MGIRSWLEDLIGIHDIRVGTSTPVTVPRRSRLRVYGSGVSVFDDAANDETVINFTGGGDAISFDAVKTALAAANTAVGFNGQKLTGVGTPTTGTDGANKTYVDSLAGGYGGILALTGAANTLGLTAAGQYVTVSHTAGTVLTVPTNATAALRIGSRIPVVQYGAGQVTVAAAGGVTLRASKSLKTRAQYAELWLTKIATDEWVLSGDVEFGFDYQDGTDAAVTALANRMVRMPTTTANRTVTLPTAPAHGTFVGVFGTNLIAFPLTISAAQNINDGINTPATTYSMNVTDGQMNWFVYSATDTEWRVF